MPGWMQAVIGVSLFVGALGVLWSKAIKPAAKVISQAEQTVPMLATITKEWHDIPGIAAMLKEIYAEFKTNSGSTLKDDIVKLSAAAVSNQVAAEENHRLLVELRLEYEVQKRIGDNDRRIMEDLIRLVNVLDARVQVGVSGVADIKTEQAGVAENLVVAQGQVDRVAAALLASDERIAGVAEALAISDEKVAAVAANLRVSKSVVAAVAEDLRLAHERARGIEGSAEAGKAADAAARGRDEP